MTVKRWVLVPGALAVLGMVVGLATPASLAGQAETITPAQTIEMPEGSQIPASRRESTEERLREYRARIRARSAIQQQENPSQSAPTKPEGEGPK